MKTLEQMKEDLALHLNEQAVLNREERIITALFAGVKGKCDCDECQFRGECEIDNPDFDANYCKLN